MSTRDVLTIIIYYLISYGVSSYVLIPLITYLLAIIGVTGAAAAVVCFVAIMFIFLKWGKIVFIASSVLSAFICSIFGTRTTV